MIRNPSDPDPIARVLLEWGIQPLLICRLFDMEARFQQATGRELTIISGLRSCTRQLELELEGRPAADCDVSNHTVCPARAADLRIGGLTTRSLKAEFGRAAIEAGLRWGGGSPVDSGGIPSDWNHVDLGRRPAGLPTHN